MIDTPDEISELLLLRDELRAISVQVRGLNCGPASDPLPSIAPLFLAAQSLLARLAGLAGGPHPALTGNRPAQRSLAESGSAVARAGTDLASALAAHRHEDVGRPANPYLTAYLSQAAARLDLAANRCLDTAATIERTAAEAPAAGLRRKPPIHLTDAQLAALIAFSQGGARRYRGLRGGGLRISVPGRQHVSITTFDILNRHGLVSWDNSTALYIGQDITVTKEGQRALAGRRSERSSTAAPAPASAPTASPGVGR
ncbi:hypothetical protein ACFC0S_00065 [Streptomyces sp. NPDC056084]|uniref:hypothetical protein n=1 Tax=unclassified Streptomyces TaxID=2593676 RepID=UPI0035DBB350